MRKGFVAALFWMAPLIGFCQGDLLSDLLAVGPIETAEGPTKIKNHIDYLRTKQSKKELAFLHKIFWSTQQTFFKTYSPYVTFNDLFIAGKYDCLTATSLYSLVLTELNLDYSIIETNYHIFIIVHASSGDVLFETTDRYHGFVPDKKEIEKRIGTYKENLIASSNPSSYLYSFELYKKISPTQLAGLLHFNQAVNAFNKHDWIMCADELVLSGSKYDSPRVKELATLLVQSVLCSNAKDEVRDSILQRFKPYWLEKQLTVAKN